MYIYWTNSLSLHARIRPDRGKISYSPKLVEVGKNGYSSKSGEQYGQWPPCIPKSVGRNSYSPKHLSTVGVDDRVSTIIKFFTTIRVLR
jgi:hypothetical protein